VLSGVIVGTAVGNKGVKANNDSLVNDVVSTASSTSDDDSGAVGVGLGRIVVLCCAEVVKIVLESRVVRNVLDGAGCSEAKNVVLLGNSLTSVDVTPGRGLVLI
jgi:hypothetical protein